MIKQSQNRPKVIGHRGCGGLAPENTLAGFQKAIDLGVDAIEFDVHLTQDGHVVVYHDMKLNPHMTKNAQGHWINLDESFYLRELTLAELQQYTVGEVRPGSIYASFYPDLKPMPNEHIPTLDDIVHLVKQQPSHDLELFIDLKTSPIPEEKSSDLDRLVPLVLEKLKKANLHYQARILSFDFRSLKLVHSLMPEIKTHYLTTDDLPFDSAWMKDFWTASQDCSVHKLIRRAGGTCWSPCFKNKKGGYLEASNIKAAQAQGLEIVVWTPNAKEDLQAMINLGVDGITTDRPDFLLELLKPIHPKGGHNQ